MSGFTGTQQAGAMRAHRAQKREQAVARNQKWADHPDDIKRLILIERPGRSNKQVKRTGLRPLPPDGVAWFECGCGLTIYDPTDDLDGFHADVYEHQSYCDGVAA